jgi:acylphosphatase
MKRAHVWIRGRVQGVGFRYSALERATSLRVTGWVRNRPDGSVEAVFEGRDEAVDLLVDWCRRGPHGAAVANVEVAWEDPAAEDGRFNVR